jgi:anti-sigma regulatory factor (Ser/Thr protein kinase)
MTEPSDLRDLELEMFSQPRLLACARAVAGSFAQRVGFNEIECGQISLAVDEALCNIINHGYDRRPDGRIRISISSLPSEPGGLRIEVEDRAKQVDLASIRSRDLDDIRPGGLGVYIIREIMDDVQYEHRDGGGMRLSMVKQLRTDGDGTREASGAGKEDTSASSSQGESHG